MDLLGDQAVLQNHALQGKTALICGASRGIGAATARIMAKAGANVILASRNEEQLNSLKKLQSIQHADIGDPEILTKISNYEMAYRMQTSVPEVMDLSLIHI